MYNMRDFVSRKDDDLVIKVNDCVFYTTYDKILYKILENTTRSYKINRGTRPEEKDANNPALIFCVKNGYGPTIDIAFAEIVYQFFSGFDFLREIAETGGWAETSRKIVQNHFFLS